MKESWSYQRLGSTCKTSAGGTPLKNNKKYYDNGTIPWIRSGEVNNRSITDSKIKITKEGLNNSSAKLFPARTVVIAMYGATAGQVGILNFACSTNQAVCGIMPNEKFIPEFLYYFFLNFKEKLIAQAVGNAQPNISQTKIKNTLIPIISIEEQKQIVKLLDSAFEKIDQAKANLEKNIANAKELFQSKLNEVFSQRGDGWEERTLDEVCKITSKLINPKEAKYQELLHVGGGNIIAETGELINLKTAKEEGLKSGKFAFNTNVVLYNKIRPYLVKVTRPNFNGLCSADMYPLTPSKEKITKDFLYFLLISNDFTKYAISGSARAGMPKVNRKHLFRYTFSLPSIKTQNNIIKDLDFLHRKSKMLKCKYNKKNVFLEELKKSLLQKAFSGELV